MSDRFIKRANAGDVATETTADLIVLFDGVCNLCNASVLFVIDRDAKRRFKFAPLQSEEGRRLLALHAFREADLSSVVLIKGERIYTRSTAALHIARELNSAWFLLYAFIIIPQKLRDAIYNFIAAHRYRWFGKEDSCRVPTPELRQRFLV